MSDSPGSERGFGQGSPEERISALFADLVIQQTNMALMLMGKVPHPETGEQVQDLEAAQLLIDQLEMIEVKTKGNRDAREEQLLKQSLTALRMAFVESIESAPAERATRAGQAPSPAAAPASGTGSVDAPPAAESGEESRKKFSKKY